MPDEQAPPAGTPQTLAFDGMTGRTFTGSTVPSSHPCVVAYIRMGDGRSARSDALAFLMRNKTAVLATAGHDNLPHASAIHYYADHEFNIFFLTLSSSRKYKALSAHPQVALAVLREDVPQTLQIEGMAKDITTSNEMQEKKDKVAEIFTANPFFFPPISKLDPATPSVIWIRPTWIRWADYAFAQYGTNRVFKEIPIEK